MYQQSWYMVQVKLEDRDEWLDFGARIPITGSVNDVRQAWAVRSEQSDRNPHNDYRIIIRTEQQLA